MAGYYSSFQSNNGGNSFTSEQSRRATDDFAVTKNYSDSDAYSSSASSKSSNLAYANCCGPSGVGIMSERWQV